MWKEKRIDIAIQLVNYHLLLSRTLTIWAQVMKLVDMLDSKSGVRKDVRVRVPPWAIWIRLPYYIGLAT